MGMAASQARFLGLTARKTNVEYEGQQVNQQRTVLANESSGLFNQMLALKVPTPPSASDYYNTRYVFDSDDTQFGITKWDVSTDDKSVYNITIQYPAEVKKVNPSKNTNGAQISYKKDDTTGELSYYIAVGSDSTGKTTEAKMTKMDPNNADDKKIIDELNSARKDSTETSYYSYAVGTTNYYIPASALEGLGLSEGGTSTTTLNQSYYYTTTENRTTTANANFTEADGSDGRFDAVTISNVADTELADSLNGKTYSLSLTQVNDEAGYDEAMEEYNYQKMLYERSIQDINAKTEIIQQQDRTLELRLKQLDTEQEAIKTEMDAVKEVIQKNVESTFKTFA